MNKLKQILPDVIDIVLFLLVAFSIYFKNHSMVSDGLLGVACFLMWLLIFRQVQDCWTQKRVYNFTMLMSVVSLKMDCSTRIVRDTIIYGLHIYLFTLNQSYVYLFSFGLCLFYDVLLYNGAFNPFMRKHMAKAAVHFAGIKQFQE